MAELDPIIAEILLKGDSEFLGALSRIGSEGAEHLSKLMEAAHSGASGLTTLANAAGILESAIAATTAAFVGFVESQDEATQKTAFLATAMGTTASQINGIEDAFAAAGVSANTFERFAQRLTTTLAQQWPQITSNIRTAATQQSEAQEAVVGALLHVKKAQDDVAFGAEEDGQKIASANLRVEQTYFNLRKVIEDGASAAQTAMHSVQDAELSAEAAHQRLAGLQGNGPSDADKKSLQLRQAQQAADEADQAVRDKRVAQQREAQEQAQKVAAAQLAASAAQLAQEKTLAELQNAQLTRNNALAEARDRAAGAAERDAKQQLTNIPLITTALQGVIDKNAAVAKSVDLGEVSVRNLTGSLFNLAAQGNNGLKPEPIKVFNELVKLLSKNTDGLISSDQELALVQQLGSRSMMQQAGSVAELLAAIKHGPEYFKSYIDAAKEHYSTTEQGIQAAEDFKKALESLSQAVQLTMRDLAALSSPALITFLNEMKASLKDANGLLFNVVEAFKALGTAMSGAITVVVGGLQKMGESLGLEKWTLVKAALIGILALIGSLAISLFSIPATITLIVVAAGLVYEAFFKVGQAMQANKGAFAALGIAVLAVVSLFAPWMVIISLISTAVVMVYRNWDKVADAVGRAKDATLNYFHLISDAELAKRNAERDTAAAARVAAADKKEADSKAAEEKGHGAGATTAGGATAAAGGQAADKLDAVAKSAADAAAALDGTAKAADKWDNGAYKGGLPFSPNLAPGAVGFAGGGEVHGPGSTTSDSIMARLSRGEFVNNAKSVAHYGADFFHALNNMTLPGFAAGGLVPSPVRLPGGSGAGQASSTLNLSIDGRAFNGLRGPKSTIDDLSSFAIARQTSAAGNNPSWMR